MPRDANFAVRLPDELKARAQRYAEVNDLSIGQVIRKALREFLSTHQPEKQNEN